MAFWGRVGKSFCEHGTDTPLQPDLVRMESSRPGDYYICKLKSPGHGEWRFSIYQWFKGKIINTIFRHFQDACLCIKIELFKLHFYRIFSLLLSQIRPNILRKTLIVIFPNTLRKTVCYVVMTISIFFMGSNSDANSFLISAMAAAVFDFLSNIIPSEIRKFRCAPLISKYLIQTIERKNQFMEMLLFYENIILNDNIAQYTTTTPEIKQEAQKRISQINKFTLKTIQSSWNHPAIMSMKTPNDFVEYIIVEQYRNFLKISNMDFYKDFSLLLANLESKKVFDDITALEKMLLQKVTPSIQHREIYEIIVQKIEEIEFIYYIELFPYSNEKTVQMVDISFSHECIYGAIFRK